MSEEQYAYWNSTGGSIKRLGMKWVLLRSSIVREFIHPIAPPLDAELRAMGDRDAEYRAIEAELLAYEAKMKG